MLTPDEGPDTGTHHLWAFTGWKTCNKAVLTPEEGPDTAFRRLSCCAGWKTYSEAVLDKGAKLGLLGRGRAVLMAQLHTRLPFTAALCISSVARGFVRCASPPVGLRTCWCHAA